MPDPIAVCAAGESAWHAAAYAGLNARWRDDGAIAWAPERVPHPVLLAAVTLTPRPVLPADLGDRAPGVIRDSWARLVADDLPGWTCEPADPWMLRKPGPRGVPSVPGVQIAQTADALLFERTSFLAAAGRPPANPGELHPAGSATVEGLHLFLARRGSDPVGTALAVRHAHGVTVSAVNVLPAERGRGVGAALTAAAANLAPGVPATLSASRLGLGVYRRLGFVVLAGTPLHWIPPS